MKWRSSKTRFCQHPNGCVYDAIRQAIKQLKYGVIISSILQLLKSLRALTKGLVHFKKSFTPEYLSIIVFLCASTLALRITKCTLRLLRNRDDGINSFLGGAAAGYVGTVTLNKNYWYPIIMFISSRIIGTIYQCLRQKGILNPERSHLHYFLIFVFSNVVHAYGYFIEPDILKADIYNLYEKMAVLTPNEKRWHLSSLIFKEKELKESGTRILTDFHSQKIYNLKKQVARSLPQV